MSSDPTVPRFLSPAVCRSALGQLAQIPNTTSLQMLTAWRGDVRWARNRVYVGRDWRDNQIGPTNQVDPVSLHALVALAQHDEATFPTYHSAEFVALNWADTSPTYPATHIWSDRTYAQPSDKRENVAVELVASAEKAGMLSAGYISVEARGEMHVHYQSGRIYYAPRTIAQCSMTVRDSAGRASGWAGASSYDWNRFDAAKLAAIALDKCLKSRNPLKIEPGRYTVILEPQATFGILEGLMRGERGRALNRALTEDPLYPYAPFRADRVATYSLRDGSTVTFDPTRMGEQVMDERVTISFDPLDPDLGVLPFTGDGDAVVPVTWFDKGVLKNLSYDRKYAMKQLLRDETLPNTGAFRMNGGTTTVEEMIATTQRGLLITRFWGVSVLDSKSLLSTGVTRDGLWLIEHGQIKHSVMNMRFTESPLFVFNQLEQLGVPVPVFTPEIPAIVPPVKIREFNFTSLTDAI